MTCNGCGSENHFYKVCKNPSKEAYRSKKISEISILNAQEQANLLHSYYVQIGYIVDNLESYFDTVDGSPREQGESALEEAHSIANMVDINLN